MSNFDNRPATPRAASNNTLYFIVGALVIAVLIIGWFMYGGNRSTLSGATPAATTTSTTAPATTPATAPAASDTTTAPATPPAGADTTTAPATPATPPAGGTTTTP